MRLLVTEESGKLARWLRLMGYDTELAKTGALPELYRQACNEQRVVVTRNQRVRPSSFFRVIHLASPMLQQQLQQLKQELGVAFDEERAFTRCDQCNAALEPVAKAQVEGRVPPFVYQTQQEFRRCPACGRLYWPATHAQRIRRVLEQVSA